MTEADPTDAPTVLARTEDGVLELTMRYERRRNALAAPLRESMAAQLEAGMADPEVRVVLLTGAGGHFSAGGDISGMRAIGGLAGRVRMAQSQRLVRLIAFGDKPVIAAVEGHAAGAGLSLAAACDIVVAPRAATFTCSFARIGLVPDMGAAWTLSRRMSSGALKLLMFTARPLPAERAAEAGLVDVLAEPGKALAEAWALAREIAAVAPLSNTLAKALVTRLAGSLDESLRAEADAQGLLYATEDFAEGRAAFGEKRAARFRGV